MGCLILFLISISEEKAINLNLRVQVDIHMELTGISNNEADLIGSVEDVPITIGKTIWGQVLSDDYW